MGISLRSLLIVGTLALVGLGGHHLLTSSDDDGDVRSSRSGREDLSQVEGNDTESFQAAPKHPNVAALVYPICDHRGRRWGAMSREGQVLVPIKYDDVSRGVGNVRSAIVCEDQCIGQESILLVSNSEWCFVGLDEIRVLEPLTTDSLKIVNFGLSLFGIYTGNTRRHLPELVFDPLDHWKMRSEFSPRGPFSDGLISVLKGNHWGFADRKGKIVIEPHYESVHHFSEGLAAVRLNDKWGFIDTSGAVVLDFLYDRPGNFSRGVALVGTSEQLVPFFIDRQGVRQREWQPGTRVKYRQFGLFSEDLAFLSSPEDTTPYPSLVGLINTAGEWVVEPRLRSVILPTEGLAAAIGTKATETGFIGTDGKMVIPLPEATDLRCFSGGLAWIKTNGPDGTESGYIDRNGNWAWQYDKSAHEGIRKDR